MHEDKGSEAALAQAVDHDPESPGVWAHLTLAALRCVGQVQTVPGHAGMCMVTSKAAGHSSCRNLVQQY
jgi:hypothetical protein